MNAGVAVRTADGSRWTADAAEDRCLRCGCSSRHVLWCFVLQTWMDRCTQLVLHRLRNVQPCLQHKAPQYMTGYCIHTSDIGRRQHLRSAGCHQLFVPPHRRSMFGRRAFSVSCPAAWNPLPDYVPHPSRSFSPGPENFSFLVH